MHSQGLRASVTTLDRLLRDDQTLFLYLQIAATSMILAGGLKTGYKKLYLCIVRPAAYVFMFACSNLQASVLVGSV